MSIQKRVRSEAIHEHANPLAHAGAALQELHASWDCAHDVDSDAWDFAVQIGCLTSLGLGESGLRWLARKGYVHHAHEITGPADTTRRFQPEFNLAFTKKTCIVLTDAGHLWLAAEYAALTVFRLHEEPSTAVSAPRWGKTTRTLFYGDRIVKRYRQPAVNQETILSAFEEEAWVHAIDNPLPPLDNESPSEMRLRDTIRRLNLNQVNPLLRFYGDGSGLRVAWEAVEQAALPLEAARRKARRAA